MSQLSDAFVGKQRYCCVSCSIVIFLASELVSKAFHGREGTGFLTNTAVNVRIGKREERQLLTGMHTVADVFCQGCDSRIGWTYLKAFESTEKYKEGKYLLEKARVYKENNWKLEDNNSSLNA